MIQICVVLGQHDDIFLFMCIFLVLFFTVVFVLQNYYTIANSPSSASDFSVFKERK